MHWTCTKHRYFRVNAEPCVALRTLKFFCFSGSISFISSLLFILLSFLYLVHLESWCDFYWSFSCQPSPWIKSVFRAKLEKAMAPHSSTLAWKIPWAEEPSRLQSMGSRSRTWLSDFTFTFHFHALEKEMATHSSVLAWRISGTGEPVGLPSMGSHRVGHDWSDLAAAAAAATAGGKAAVVDWMIGP